MSIRNIKLILSYDGTDYHGWQVQASDATVQQVVERAIQVVTGKASRLACAGRTDSGVHAVGQVACFKTESKIPAVKFQAALQRHLPENITIRESAEVPEDFHAGYDAKWKLYRYLILNSRVPNALLNRFSTRISAPLNVQAMDQAAQFLVGVHDFRSFETDYPNKATSIRHIKHCKVRQGNSWPLWEPDIEGLPLPANDSSLVYLDIVADGFLYNMVRAIMGTLLQIGRGDWPVEATDRILKQLDRKEAGPTAPPQGLYLMHVEYEREFDEFVASR
ncbi:MAG: tRNA pseudouridine(38-40) synthase TruA [Planctomycetaceae bacterium]|nr:tRNA pseudouridine(38-40) synthase TruA [Planctomycetaceae bacterium]